MKQTILLFLLLHCIPIIGQQQVGDDIDGNIIGGRFGLHVSISQNGEYVAIGSSDSPMITRVLRNENNTWLQVGDTIFNQSYSYGGLSPIALSPIGTRIAVGDPFNDQDPLNKGLVRVFELQNDNWVQVGDSITIGAGTDERFGQHVSLSSDGSRLIIGAYFKLHDGSARVYEEVNGTWQQIGGRIQGAESSVDISPDGNTIAVAYDREKVGSMQNAGRVTVYEYIADQWVRVNQPITGSKPWATLGTSISLSYDGQRIACGGDLYSATTSGIGQHGHVRVFENNQSGSWVQVGEIIRGARSNDQAGSRVSLSHDGNKVALGATGADQNGTLSGNARVFVDRGNWWDQYGQTINGERAWDRSGDGLALSGDGNTIIIGAPTNEGSGPERLDDDRGHARVFEFDISLPVEFNSFVAKALKNVTQLSWQTIEESNNRGFYIERSQDGENYNSIGFVVGTNEASKYHFIDENPAFGTNYYRLQQQDFDGTISISEVQTVRFDEETSTLLLYPNPANSTLNVGGVSLADKTILNLINSQGQVVQTVVGQTQLNVANLAAGNYLIQAVNGATSEYKKVIINH